MPVRHVAFLSDYGYRDPFVGVCHAVIARTEPAIPVIDLTHGIAPQNVRGGAIAIADAIPFLPRDIVLIAVVDPGVGSERRAVAVQTFDGQILVGPDNGLFTAAIALCGGAEKVAELSSSPWRLQPMAETFHGRDIFSPVAARLAAGAPFEKAGKLIDPQLLVTIELPAPELNGGDLRAEALDIDIFSNIRLAAARADLEQLGVEDGARVQIETAGMRTPARFVKTFADVEPLEALVFEDANRSLSIAINQGHAATELGIKLGTTVRIIPE